MKGNEPTTGRACLTATRHACVAIAFVFSWAVPTAAQRVAEAGDVVIANLASNTVSWYDGSTGEYLGDIVGPGSGGLVAPTGVAFGPDGHLYVSSSGNDRILRYDGRTGAFLDVFVESEILSRPFSLAFGPDGDLFVSSGTGHRVLRIDGETGDVEGEAAASETLQQPIGLAFGPDGLLYVANSGARRIDRYDPATGSLLGSFGGEHLAFVSDLTLDPDGVLLASSAANGTVTRFDGPSGAFLGLHARLPEGGVPMGLGIGHDGSLLVGDFVGGRIFRVRSTEGPVEIFAQEGMSRPENMAVKPTS